ncbi:PREDICTED: oxysterol-binding protein-related protein 1C-like [Camelina sativa]|uniref:Oxysterol-binding protein-related protein 1C-like n=1 Tax=Camelina sativa TaxID=90675 RepID=A0ABM1RL95_CAMSA|nr:PREDICTED: oxysterol-binding protein-related protein 1C-like [Camelina sativa]
MARDGNSGETAICGANSGVYISIQLDHVGVLTLQFDDGETLQWSKVTASIYNLMLGKFYCDHYDTMRIKGSAEYSCKLKFKEQSIIDRNPHQVHGIVQDKSGKTVATMFGKWDENMHFVRGQRQQQLYIYTDLE